MSHQHDDRNWEIIEAGKRKRWQTVSGIAAESYRKNRSLPNQSFRFVAEAFCRENRSDTSVLVRTLFPRLKDAKRNKYAALLWTEMSDVWERASCAHALRVAKRAAECTRSLSSATTIPEESAALLTIVERLSSTKTTTDLAMSTFGAMRRNDMVLILFDKIVRERRVTRTSIDRALISATHLDEIGTREVIVDVPPLVRRHDGVDTGKTTSRRSNESSLLHLARSLATAPERMVTNVRVPDVGDAPFTAWVLNVQKKSGTHSYPTNVLRKLRMSSPVLRRLLLHVVGNLSGGGRPAGGREREFLCEIVDLCGRRRSMGDEDDLDFLHRTLRQDDTLFRDERLIRRFIFAYAKRKQWDVVLDLLADYNFFDVRVGPHMLGVMLVAYCRGQRWGEASFVADAMRAARIDLGADWRRELTTGGVKLDGEGHGEMGASLRALLKAPRAPSRTREGEGS